MEIKLPCGSVCLIDDKDFKKVSSFSWSGSRGCRTKYAVAYNPSDKKPIKMHRLLLNTQKGVIVDHINGNGLDNRRGNLRLASHQQNIANQTKRSIKTSSKYKGVWQDRRRSSWYAAITANYKHKFIGSFKSEEEAARAYDKMAKEKFGEFARTNF